MQFSQEANNNSNKTTESKNKKDVFGVAYENEDVYEDEDEDEDDDDDDVLSTSARTADEQLDYLEGLEPCPCYARCCIDSVVTLICVTLLG